MAWVSVSRSRSLFLTSALVLLTVLGSVSTVRADDILEPGEILAATGYAGAAVEGHIARVAPDPPHNVEIVTTEGDLSVAVASPVTIYTLDFAASGPGYVLRLNAVNVVTGTVSMVYEFAYAPGSYFGKIAVEPAGTIVALLAGAYDGRVVRIDPYLPDAPSQEPEVVVAQTPDIGIGLFGIPDIRVASNGDIFVTSWRKLWQVDSNALTPVWSDAASTNWGSALDVDRKTGELLAMYNGQLVRADPNSDPYQGTLVFENATSWLGIYSPIALDADNSILYSSSGSVFRKRFEAEPGELIYEPPQLGLVTGTVWDVEVVLPGCSNGLDDNRDGQWDHSGGDPLCTSPDVPFECSVGFGRSNGSAAWLLLLPALLLRRRVSL